MPCVIDGAGGRPSLLADNAPVCIGRGGQRGVLTMTFETLIGPSVRALMAQERAAD